MELYHYTLGFPPKFNPNVGTVRLAYSRHALEAAKNDRYGDIKLRGTLDTTAAKCIELGLERGHVKKLVYRISYSSSLDLILACYIEGSHFKVATVWLNLKSDQHCTLDASRYVNLKRGPALKQSQKVA